MTQEPINKPASNKIIFNVKWEILTYRGKI